MLFKTSVIFLIASWILAVRATATTSSDQKMYTKRATPAAAPSLLEKCLNICDANGTDALKSCYKDVCKSTSDPSTPLPTGNPGETSTGTMTHCEYGCHEKASKIVGPCYDGCIKSDKTQGPPPTTQEPPTQRSAQ